MLSVQTFLLLVPLKHSQQYFLKIQILFLPTQANCLSYKPITIDHEGACCNSECPDEKHGMDEETSYCGSDGITYGNKCLLDYVSFCSLQSFYTFILSHFHTFTLSHFHTFTLSHFHTFTLSHFHTFTLSHFHTFTPQNQYLPDNDERMSHDI